MQSTHNNILLTNSSDFSTHYKKLRTEIANDMVRPYSFDDKEKLNPHGKPILPLRPEILYNNDDYKNYPTLRECFIKLNPKNPYGKLVKDYNFNRDPYYKDKKELVADIKESITKNKN